MVKVGGKDKGPRKYQLDFPLEYWLVHEIEPQAIPQILQHRKEEKNREGPDRVKR